MREVIKNSKLCEDSFLYCLSYRYKFDIQKFNLLINDLILIIKEYSRDISACSDSTINEYAAPIFYIYDRFTFSIISSLRKDSVYRIENMPMIEISDYIQRFRFIVNCFFNKQSYSRIFDYEDELGKLVEDIENE